MPESVRVSNCVCAENFYQKLKMGVSSICVGGHFTAVNHTKLQLVEQNIFILPVQLSLLAASLMKLSQGVRADVCTCVLMYVRVC